jgi:hypothetical protein
MKERGGRSGRRDPDIIGGGGGEDRDTHEGGLT